MHRFQSQSTITRFKFASVLLCLKYLLIPGVAGLLGYALINSDKELVFYAIGLGAGTLLLNLLQWGISQRTRCPLCLTPVLASKGCSKHRNARTVLGSYRLRVALAVIFRGAFVCPYCHESSVMQTRGQHTRGRRERP